VAVTVDELEVADPADSWTRAEFSVDSDAVCRIGGVRISLVGPGITSFFGDRTSPVKDAVQPGRRITTLRHREFGLSVPSAMISASR
jgi:hypothetical protein